ncbi:MAG TPA: DNA polymerase III subunit beta, partial [Streptomyces sp.]|nr:DNA polymerase III subunit beta [Streptomyces sp.]
LEAGDRQTAGRCLGHEFPDYRRLVRLPAGRRVTVDAPALAEAVRSGPVRASEVREQDGVAFDVSVLAVTGDGAVTVAGYGDEDGGGYGDGERDGAGPVRVAVNREFLLHALSAGGRDRLVLEFGGPTAPVAVRRPDDEGTFSLLMPVRLEG